MADDIHPVYNADESYWQVGQTRLVNVHPVWVCGGPDNNEPCPFHRPTEHRMRHMPMLWRDDRKILERICSHGIGHPDPDQNAHWKRTGRTYESVHGCDGCCTW